MQKPCILSRAIIVTSLLLALCSTTGAQALQLALACSLLLLGNLKLGSHFKLIFVQGRERERENRFAESRRAKGKVAKRE